MGGALVGEVRRVAVQKSTAGKRSSSGGGWRGWDLDTRGPGTLAVGDTLRLEPWGYRVVVAGGAFETAARTALAGGRRRGTPSVAAEEKG